MKREIVLSFNLTSNKEFEGKPHKKRVRALRYYKALMGASQAFAVLGLPSRGVAASIYRMEEIRKQEEARDLELLMSGLKMSNLADLKECRFIYPEPKPKFRQPTDQRRTSAPNISNHLKVKTQHKG